MLSVLGRCAMQRASQAAPRSAAFAPALSSGAMSVHAVAVRPRAVCQRRPIFVACRVSEPNPALPTDVFDTRTRDVATTAHPPMSENAEVPQVNEDDLEEQFVRGSGPGGQKINKTASCVLLKHKPSGVTVRCQETRSQMKNRQLARKILQRKLDEIMRGEQSAVAQELSKARARKARRRRKSVKKHFKSKRDKALLDF